jgi:hypothetical protein
MTSAARTTLVIWLMVPAFLAVAAWLALASPRADIPRGKINQIDLKDIQPGAWRTPLMDSSKGVVNGTQRQCSECHKLFTPSPVENRTLVQHKEIVLSHGMNTRCLNCHDGANRDKLVLHDGTLVNFADTPRLCSQCHGTVYRDWQRGTHGKTMGSWEASSGKQVRLTCNECHNPHAPAYQPLAPLPGPNTMRMGDQSHTAEPERRHEPLRKWSHPESSKEPSP